MTQLRAFKQVDVFTSAPLSGNPLAVVMDGYGLSTEEMQAFARWTALSETTFVLPATDPAADYQVRIFTPDGELPFAGHPTLGTAHALLESGIKLQQPGQIIQQCALGLVTITIAADGSLAFAAPPATLSPYSNSAGISRALNSDQLHPQLPVMVADMGIRWLLVPMVSASAVLAVKADASGLTDLMANAGVNGVMPFAPREQAHHYEVRALLNLQGAVTEDPVTGSANACLARYFAARSQTDNYLAHQGTAISRAGLVSVSWSNGDIWIGGQTVTTINGSVSL